MDVRLINRSRNLTLVPTKAISAPDQDLFEVMRGLVGGSDPDQCEFRCDREFRSALDVQAMKEQGVTFRPLEDGELLVDSLDGIPIIVED